MDLFVDLSQNSVVQIGQDALRLKSNAVTAKQGAKERRSRGSDFTVKKLVLDDNMIGNMDFLADPCTLVFGNQSSVSVRNNQIKCDCFLYNLTRLRVVKIQGSCASPSHYLGANLNGHITTHYRNVFDQPKDLSVDPQDWGISHLTQKFGGWSSSTAPRRRTRPGSFLQAAEGECSAAGTDKLLHQKYDCRCGKWKPYIQAEIFSSFGPEVAAAQEQQQQCSTKALSPKTPNVNLSVHVFLSASIIITFLQHLS